MDTLTGKMGSHSLYPPKCLPKAIKGTVHRNAAVDSAWTKPQMSKHQFYHLAISGSETTKKNTQEWIPCFNLFYVPTFFQYTIIWFYYLRAACIHLFWFKISENLRTETVNHVSVSDAAKLSLNVLIWLAVSSMPSLRKENLPVHPFTAGKNPECLF